MIKKYLTTPEEILALKDTDTKIYIEDSYNYYKFVNGCLCWFDTNGDFDFNATMSVGEFLKKKYILVEEPVKEADENDIGKLCKFWNDNPSDYEVGTLYEISEEKADNYPYAMDSFYGCWYKHCRRLTPAEVAEITGYKVEK